MIAPMVDESLGASAPSALSQEEMADGIRTPDNTTAYRSLVEVRTTLALCPLPTPLPTRAAPTKR